MRRARYDNICANSGVRATQARKFYRRTCIASAVVFRNRPRSSHYLISECVYNQHTGSHDSTDRLVALNRLASSSVMREAKRSTAVY